MTGTFKAGFDPRRNTKGRKKGIDISELVKRIAAEPGSETDKRTKIELLMRSVFKTAFEGDQRAVEIILERGWGKAVQPVEGTGYGPLVTIIQEPPTASPQT